MVEGTNDENKIMMKKEDGANIEVNSKDIQEINNYQNFERKILFSSSRSYFAQPK